MREEEYGWLMDLGALGFRDQENCPPHLYRGAQLASYIAAGIMGFPVSDLTRATILRCGCDVGIVKVSLCRTAVVEDFLLIRGGYALQISYSAFAKVDLYVREAGGRIVRNPATWNIQCATRAVPGADWHNQYDFSMELHSRRDDFVPVDYCNLGVQSDLVLKLGERTVGGWVSEVIEAAKTLMLLSEFVPGSIPDREWRDDVLADVVATASILDPWATKIVLEIARAINNNLIDQDNLLMVSRADLATVSR